MYIYIYARAYATTGKCYGTPYTHADIYIWFISDPFGHLTISIYLKKFA